MLLWKKTRAMQLLLTRSPGRRVVLGTRIPAVQILAMMEVLQEMARTAVANHQILPVEMMVILEAVQSPIVPITEKTLETPMEEALFLKFPVVVGILMVKRFPVAVVSLCLILHHRLLHSRKRWSKVSLIGLAFSRL